ncbi:high frequency lysogenization protein HflD [Vibrio sp. SS-MA-C1-2]|uniref:high frequency lysogenization protein HflD n=1 Tax=Vibrio sp. SS-MA-C1-2 TaxID=2908646 RepID=UPI001F2D868D|nr:high frequency lysogenization protein HflD [Vibrio sp. SS-MA-C1-2]UJF19877.1 high frequency lysogenization protein HflD [Vibrio sp. SS-MA-C1-2]
MANRLLDQTMAFAAICQSVKLVQQVARDGSCDQDALTASLNSILVTDPKSTMDVCGNERDLAIGLKAMVEELNNGQSGNELTRYLVSLMALERKLSANKEAMSLLGNRISTAQHQLDHFELLNPQMVSNLASIYLDVISPLGPRIQVTGTPAYLQQEGVQHQVRSLLLAGIRNSVLWRQVGGKRRHLLFSRKKIIEQANILLARI